MHANIATSSLHKLHKKQIVLYRNTDFIFTDDTDIIL